MKLIVLTVGKVMTSYYTKCPTQRITFKSVDENDKEYYYLNLDRRWEKEVDINNWLKYLKPGRVLEVSLQSNGKNVDMFKGFQVKGEIK